MTDFIAPLVNFTDFDRRRDTLSWRPSKQRPFDILPTSWQRIQPNRLAYPLILYLVVSDVR